MSWRFRQVVAPASVVAMDAPTCIAQKREFSDRRSIASGGLWHRCVSNAVTVPIAH
jgi:hypothetical protein